jgi:hypothetical protein
MKDNRTCNSLGFACALLMVLFGFTANAVADSVPAGWTCSGSCGSLGADGVVSLSPIGSSTYQYVTTSGSTSTAVLPTGALGSETNGSTLASSAFTATAGTDLNFYFDFVTSDGAEYADYAWAELFNSSNDPVAMLFTARTESSGSIVPGAGMPTPVATLNPSSVPILAGTAWSPLGGNSGTCWSTGCGNTGWINSDYTIADAGSYYLEIGVTNWGDEGYDTGLAMDGVMVDGQPILPTSATPEPSSFLLLASGLAGLVGVVKRKLFA